MSSLQISILIGALGVVLAVVVFNARRGSERARCFARRSAGGCRSGLAKHSPSRSIQANRKRTHRPAAQRMASLPTSRGLRKPTSPLAGHQGLKASRPSMIQARAGSGHTRPTPGRRSMPTPLQRMPMAPGMALQQSAPHQPQSLRWWFPRLLHQRLPQEHRLLLQGHRLLPRGCRPLPQKHWLLPREHRPQLMRLRVLPPGRFTVRRTQRLPSTTVVRVESRQQST
jgi:hypothetical protein